MQYLVATISGLVCIVVLWFAFKAYKDAQHLKKKAEDEEARLNS